MVTEEDIEKWGRIFEERGFKMTPYLEAAINRYLDNLNHPSE